MQQSLLFCDRCGASEQHAATSDGFSMRIPAARRQNAILQDLQVNFCAACLRAFAEFAPHLDLSWKSGLGAHATHAHAVVFDNVPPLSPTQTVQITSVMCHLSFQPEWIEFQVADPDAWALNDIKIGNRSQIRSRRPAFDFTPSAFPLAMIQDRRILSDLLRGGFDICQPHMDLTIVVTYLGEAPDSEPFRCRVHGRRGGFEHLADIEENGTQAMRDNDNVLRTWISRCQERCHALAAAAVVVPITSDKGSGSNVSEVHGSGG